MPLLSGTSTLTRQRELFHQRPRLRGISARHPHSSPRQREVVAGRRTVVKREVTMKIQHRTGYRRCFKCSAPWDGVGQPRPRGVCQGCGASLHCCANCHHFDGETTISCTLPQTTFIGPREDANYCEQFEMINARVKAMEARTQRARNVWTQLFRS